MLRWIMLVSMIAGLALLFTAKSSGVLAIGMLLILVGAVGFIGILAAERVSASARPEVTMASPEDLQALRKLRASSPSAPTPRPAQPASGAAARRKPDPPKS